MSIARAAAQEIVHLLGVGHENDITHFIETAIRHERKSADSQIVALVGQLAEARAACMEAIRCCEQEPARDEYEAMYRQLKAAVTGSGDIHKLRNTAQSDLSILRGLVDEMAEWVDEVMNGGAGFDIGTLTPIGERATNILTRHTALKAGREVPRVICDGCNVRAPHEHRCHGDNACVGGYQMLTACECPDCNAAAQKK